MVVLDEPWFAELMQPGFPIPPDEAIDLHVERDGGAPADTLTGRALLRAVRRRHAAGVRPATSSRCPLSPELVEWVGYLTRFLEDGGIIAWGVTPTDGPVPSTSDRYWRALSDLWCSLVQRGCDPGAAAPTEHRHRRSAGWRRTRCRSPDGSPG